jgi:hypothetical protein
MNMLNLYEIKYGVDQPKMLDEYFSVFDTLDVNRPRLREITAFNKFAALRSWELVGYSGIFSPRFTDKTGITGKDISGFLASHTTFDICLFHPFPMEVSISGDYLHLPELEHPGISDALERVWQDVLGQRLPSVYCPEDYMLVGHCNYFIANKKFWNGYSKFILSFYEYLSCERGLFLHQDSKYTLSSTSDYQLPLAVFVFERCLIYYLKSFENDLTITNYAYHVDLWRPKEHFLGEHDLCERIRDQLASVDGKRINKKDAFTHAISTYYHYRNLSLG